MKRAQADPMKLIVGAVILLVAAFIIIAIFRGIVSKEAGVAKDKVEGITVDTEGDGVSDILDSCPYESDKSKKVDGPCKEGCTKKKLCK